MVLALLVISALSLAGLARRSLDATEQAASAQAELQRRWGVLSAMRVYMAAAESLLDREAANLGSQGQGWPLPASISGEFVLNGLRFSALVADEDAKVNLNAIYHPGPEGNSQLASVVEQLAGGDGPPVLIRPTITDDSQRNAKPFGSWGQVFDLQETTSPTETACTLLDRTHEISLWGRGRLNVRRASDQAIRALCADKLSPDVISKLLSLRRETGVQGLDDLLDRTAPRLEDRAALERLLTDRSSRHSIWIVVRDQRRAWVTFALDRGGSGGQSSAVEETLTW
jgi:type II secretory pathway component PulK